MNAVQKRVNPLWISADALYQYRSLLLGLRTIFAILLCLLRSIRACRRSSPYYLVCCGTSVVNPLWISADHRCCSAWEKKLVRVNPLWISADENNMKNLNWKQWLRVNPLWISADWFAIGLAPTIMIFGTVLIHYG